MVWPRWVRELRCCITSRGCRVSLGRAVLSIYRCERSPYHSDIVLAHELPIALGAVAVCLNLMVSALLSLGKDIVAEVALEVERCVAQGIEVLFAGSPRLETPIAVIALPGHRRLLLQIGWGPMGMSVGEQAIAYSMLGERAW